MRRLTLMVVMLMVVMLLAAGAMIATPRSSTARPKSSACAPEQPALPPSGPHETPTVAQRPADGQPGIALVRYPRPNSPGNVWSQWGQGLVLRNGRFVSAIGDELGADGNSFLFVYDPATQQITRTDDVLSHVDHKAGEWGFGKV